MALRAATRLLTHRAALMLGNQEAVNVPRLLCFNSTHLSLHSLQGSWPELACTRLLRTSAWQQTALEIKVDSFGESITEGTVAEVLKERGDSVAEDTVILQIDTDKVTIDVRAPEGGVIDSILVKPDDVVTVGQLVAIMRTGDEASASAQAAEPEKPAPAPEPKAKQKPPPAPAAPPPEAPAPDRGSRAQIRFPPRRTPDGKRISALPAEEQAKVLDKAGPAAPDAPAQPTKPAASPAAPRARTPWYVGKERGTKLSQSRVLSEREMDVIELGGAAP